MFNTLKELFMKINNKLLFKMLKTFHVRFSQSFGYLVILRHKTQKFTKLQNGAKESHANVFSKINSEDCNNI